MREGEKGRRSSGAVGSAVAGAVTTEAVTAAVATAGAVAVRALAAAAGVGDSGAQNTVVYNEGQTGWRTQREHTPTLNLKLTIQGATMA